MEAWKKNTGRTNYFRKVLMPQRINRDSLVLLYQLPTVVPMFNVILALLADLISDLENDWMPIRQH